MTIEQTVDIPANHRLDLRLDIPPEFPTGRAIITFTPAGETRTSGSRDTPEYLRRKAMEKQSIDFINRHAEELNREAEDVLKGMERLIPRLKLALRKE
jgi:hypothetical protein